MGRYNLSAQKVHAHATQLLQLNRLSAPPAWFNVVGNVPSSEVLTRKPMQKGARSRKASKLFQPLQLEHKEDDLRWEFFNDHPWELARPRVVLENDGRDLEKWDWSHALCRPRYTRSSPESVAEAKTWDEKQHKQASRPLNGESVIQRQKWLMENAEMSQPAAYDKARKEFYSARHAQEIEQRVAREEATFYGGVFGMSAIEVGMQLEDTAYEHWREWAAQEIAKAKQVASSAYTGNEVEEVVENLEAEANEVVDSLPGSRTGQEAFGGAAVHP